MQQIGRTLTEVSNRVGRYRLPVLSLGICSLAYGLLTPWLGFDWDDRPLTWFSHQFGSAYFINYEPSRPLSGWLYAASFSLLGELTLAWQLYALLWRWLSVLALWWLLRLLWPTRRRLATVAALNLCNIPRLQPTAHCRNLQPLLAVFHPLLVFIVLHRFEPSSRRPFLGLCCWSTAACRVYHVLHRILLRPGTGPRPVDIKSCSTAKHRLGA